MSLSSQTFTVFKTQCKYIQSFSFRHSYIIAIEDDKFCTSSSVSMEEEVLAGEHASQKVEMIW